VSSQLIITCFAYLATEAIWKDLPTLLPDKPLVVIIFIITCFAYLATEAIWKDLPTLLPDKPLVVIIF